MEILPCCSNEVKWSKISDSVQILTHYCWISKVKVIWHVEFKMFASRTEGNKDPESLWQQCPDYVTSGPENSLFALSGPW